MRTGDDDETDRLSAGLEGRLDWPTMMMRMTMMMMRAITCQQGWKDYDDDETDRLSAGWKARAWIGQSRGTSSCQVIDPCTVLQPNSVVQCSRYEL